MGFTKERTTISIDADVIREARNKGLNVSGISEDAIKAVLFTFDQEIIPEDCKPHKWTNAFTTPFGLAKECLKCHSIHKIKLESYETTMKRCRK